MISIKRFLQNSHLHRHNHNLRPLSRIRWFQSRAEYEEWTKRVKDSRMMISGGGHHDPKLKLVNTKTAAPFLYSVSPISDRLLIYSYEDEDEDEDENENDSGGCSHNNVKDRAYVGKSPSSSMLECIYPLSESRYNHNLNYTYSPSHSNSHNYEDAPMMGDDSRNDHIHTDVSDLDILRASVSDFGSWSSVRLGKFYSDVDALTADVAYRHANIRGPNSDESHTHDSESLGTGTRSNENPIAFVTAGHYHSRKIHRTDITKDIILRCYPTHTGRSSIEIRTDALQKDDDGNEILVNVCFTSMVAVDKDTLRPVKDRIPNLTEPLKKDLDGSDIGHGTDNSSEREEEGASARQRLRTEMAKQHIRIRKERSSMSMQLCHGPSSSPPTQQEMSEIHALHQQKCVLNRNRNMNMGHNDRHNRNNGQNINLPLPHIGQHTHRSSTVVYPERRNVHGKLFGGFVMEQGHLLAQYAANFYLHHYKNSNFSTGSLTSELASETASASASTTSNHHPSELLHDRAIPLGLDEAIFLQPVSIGDHVTFTARVVHSTRRACRVIVIVEVRNPSSFYEQSVMPALRSNRLSFLFGGANFPRGGIIPDDYGEILMHVDAKRRMKVEGPLDDEVERILSEMASK